MATKALLQERIARWIKDTRNNHESNDGGNSQSDAECEDAQPPTESDRFEAQDFGNFVGLIDQQGKDNFLKFFHLDHKPLQDPNANSPPTPPNLFIRVDYDDCSVELPLLRAYLGKPVEEFMDKVAALTLVMNTRHLEVSVLAHYATAGDDGLDYELLPLNHSKVQRRSISRLLFQYVRLG